MPSMIEIFLLGTIVGLGAASPLAWNVSCASSTTATDVLPPGLDLTGKVILYIGGDGHIAGEVTLALAKTNATLVLACHTPAHCDTAAASIVNATGAVVETEQIDLSNKSNVLHTAQRITKRFSRTGIYALVNSAGSYSTALSHDGYVNLMEINTLGPALLTNQLLPLLRGDPANSRPNGRVVNVAAAVYGLKLSAPNNTVAYLTDVTKAVDPVLNATGSYFQLSKYLSIHHAIELARREPNVIAMSVNPGYAIQVKGIPQKELQLDPKIHKACHTNFKGLAACPEMYAQAAAVQAVAAAWPQLDSFSGSYLDFDTKLLSASEPQVFGPYQQSDPSCVPREPPPMDPQLRSDWFDQMLKLMA